jgi:hypothetical protein
MDRKLRILVLGATGQVGGAVPMLLTAIYSAVRALADWYRHVFPSRPSADRLTAFHQQAGPSAAAPISDPSVNLTLVNQLLNQPELL